MKTRTAGILAALESGDVALVSEAGTPGVSDPGFELVTAALDAGHDVSPIPGAAAPVAAVVASGLPGREFTFIGFLPRRASQRRQALKALRRSDRTIVAFESPRRLRAALEDVLGVLGDRRIAVCRELTKLHEEIYRATVSAAIERFSEPRGEVTLVIEGATASEDEFDESVLTERLRLLRSAGVSARNAATLVAGETGLPKRKLYALTVRKGLPNEHMR
jgi:16S rRNA (cytidine1402-2'-O)-methyltransferase